jgi:uncharacterized protein (DUF849 family)
VLLHGEESSAWPVFEYATLQGYHARIGLEDVLTNPDGSLTDGNADLVRHANWIRARGGPKATRSARGGAKSAPQRRLARLR